MNALAGNTEASAGRKIMEYMNAAMIPIATMLPRSRNGGASLKFIDRKPIAVVMLVRKIGCRLMRRLRFMTVTSKKSVIRHYSWFWVEA